MICTATGDRFKWLRDCGATGRCGFEDGDVGCLWVLVCRILRVVVVCLMVVGAIAFERSSTVGCVPPVLFKASTAISFFFRLPPRCQYFHFDVETGKPVSHHGPRHKHHLRTQPGRGPYSCPVRDVELRQRRCACRSAGVGAVCTGGEDGLWSFPVLSFPFVFGRVTVKNFGTVGMGLRGLSLHIE